MDPRKRTGRRGEDRAARALEDGGCRVIERNVACSLGEIDLVAKDGPTWVFVEVKTRKTGRYGSPLEGVTAAKQERLARLAAHYLSERGIADAPVRFDVVGIDLSGPSPRVEWVRDAFDGLPEPLA